MLMRTESYSSHMPSVLYTNNEFETPSNTSWMHCLDLVKKIVPEQVVTFSKEIATDLCVISTPVQKVSIDKIIEEIDEYKNYHANWDGICDEAPNISCLEASQCFLKRLPKGVLLPLPTISGGDDVALYWKIKDKYMIINFNADSTLSYFYKKLNYKESGDNVMFDRQSIPAQIESIITDL